MTENRITLKRRFALLLASLVLMLGLAAAGAYTLFLGVMDNQTLLFCTNVLEYGAKSEEAITRTVKDLSDQIYSDPLIFKLSGYESCQPQDLVAGLKRIATYRETSYFVDSIYVYNGLNKTFYVSSDNAPQSMIPLEDFYDRSAVELALHYQDYDFLQPVAREVTVSYPALETLYYFTFLRYNTLAEPGEASVILINVRQESYLEQIHQPMGNQDSSVYIVDRRGNSQLPGEDGGLFHSLAEHPAVRRMLEDEGTRGYYSAVIGGKGSIVGWQDLFSGHFRLVVSVNKGQRYASFDTRGRTAALLVLTVFFSLALVSSILLTRRLLRVYNEQQSSLRRAQDERRRQAYHRRREGYLRFLREGRSGQEPEVPSADCYQILLFAIGQYRTRVREQHETQAQRDLLKYGLCNILEELLQPRGGVFCVYENDGTAAALLTPGATGEEGPLEECLRDIQLQVRASLEISVAVFLSDRYGDLEDTRQVYASMRDALPYQQVLGLESITWMHEIEAREERDYPYPEAEVKKIVAGLMSGEFDQVRAGIQALLRHFATFSYTSFHKHLLRLMVVLDESLQKYLANNAFEKPMQFSAQIFNLMTLDTVEDICVGFSGILQRVEDICRSKKNSRQDELVEAVQAFVAGNYGDRGLSVNLIADSLGMSPAYVGRLFKRATGQTLSEYVLQVRIGAAQELLAGTEYSVKLIAERVGFSDEPYFYKMFKRVNGTTPNQYRSLHKGR